jgi:hypothetical protein
MSHPQSYAGQEAEVTALRSASTAMATEHQIIIPVIGSGA